MVRLRREGQGFIRSIQTREVCLYRREKVCSYCDPSESSTGSYKAQRRLPIQASVVAHTGESTRCCNNSLPMR